MNKSVVIYIKLIEGIETWVPVGAIDMGNGIYTITDNKYLQLKDDATSIWEFFPGDTVNCRKEGDYIKAFELISSTFKNRKIYELIYLIVSNLGQVNSEQIRFYENEINELCSNSNIYQKNHPLVINWLQVNCPGSTKNN